MRIVIAIVLSLLALVGCSHVVTVTSAPINYQLTLCADQIYRASCPPPVPPASSYIGIPAPDGQVPADLMPTEPVNTNLRTAFPYDPIGTVTPTPTGAANQWVISCTGNPSASAGNGGQGTVALPLDDSDDPFISSAGIGSMTITTPGTQVFYVGDGCEYTAGTHMEDVQVVGNVANQTWVIGIGATKPIIRAGRFFPTHVTYAYFDNLQFSGTAVQETRIAWNASGLTAKNEFVVFRDIDCSGANPGVEAGASRRCFSLSGSETFPLEFVVIYNSDMHGYGRWQGDYFTGTDTHGVQVNSWARYVWVLGNRIREMQGDGIQCGNSITSGSWGGGWTLSKAHRPQFIYIGGNEIHSMYENAYDQKGCYHVVVSENEFHNLSNATKGANNTAVIIEQDSETYFGGLYTWFFANEVYNTVQAFRTSATTGDANPVLAFNVVHTLIDSPAGGQSEGLAYVQRCYTPDSGDVGPGVPVQEECADGFHYIHNTVDCTGGFATALTNVQGLGTTIANPQQIVFAGNLWLNCEDATSAGNSTSHGWEQGGGADDRANIVYTDNLLSRPTAETWNTHGLIDTDTNTTRTSGITLDASFVPSGVAIDYVPAVHSELIRFNTLYGLDVLSFNGQPLVAPLNAGAVQ